MSDKVMSLCHRNCLLKHVIEGKLEGRRRRGRRRKHLLDDINENRRYWKLSERALDRYRPVVRQTAELINAIISE
jgi:hypothetical protein